MNSPAARLINLFLCLALLFSIGCIASPATPDVIPAGSQSIPAAHTRKLQTPPYEGGSAVIFVLDQIDDDKYIEAVPEIIRVFAENDASIDVAVKPPATNFGLNESTRELTYFSDAGILDTSVDGHYISWLKPQTSLTGGEYAAFSANLVLTRDQIKYIFGSAVYSCLLPTAAINEANYRALQDSGFKVIAYSGSGDLKPSIKPVNWSGQVDTGGLYRLPIVGEADLAQAFDNTTALYNAAKRSINDLGVAVIELPVTSVLDTNNKPMTAKLLQLSSLVKSCQGLGDVTTLDNWYEYITGCPMDAAGIKRPLPPYHGGPIIIFRLDDVARGYREEVVHEIIKVFERNGVPLDCGVVSNVDGTESYEIPWLKEYVDDNVVGISVHGYDWTYYQLDITQNYLKHIEDNPCINVYAAKAEAEKAKVSYEELQYKLIQARCKYLKYFGVNPISFTVPTDYYDELGYKAIQNAGYKVFSVYWAVEPCSSLKPVDYNCHVDLEKGMYRIPTASDLCVWYNCQWTDVVNMDKPMKQPGYCVYVGAYGESQEYNDAAITICNNMNAQGVAVVGLHPDCFVDKNGKPDMAKLEQVDTLIKWFKSFATILTFEQWYRYHTGDK
ncbi:MAG: DUF2334 domain-containing protein [Dehalococcoidia bacterium]|jgi:peptidoglycan/xylan/chitin deacetylase (PgdA/CDA1 family)